MYPLQRCRDHRTQKGCKLVSRKDNLSRQRNLLPCRKMARSLSDANLSPNARSYGCSCKLGRKRVCERTLRANATQPTQRVSGQVQRSRSILRKRVPALRGLHLKWLLRTQTRLSRRDVERALRRPVTCWPSAKRSIGRRLVFGKTLRREHAPTNVTTQARRRRAQRRQTY